MDIITYYLLGVVVNIVAFILVNDGTFYNVVTDERDGVEGIDYVFILIDILIWPINALLGIIMSIIKKDVYRIVISAIHLLWPVQLIFMIVTLIHRKIKKNNQ